MKIFAAILILAFISSVEIYGQVEGPGKQFKIQKSDSLFIKPLFEYPNKRFDSGSGKIIKPGSDFVPKHFRIDSAGLKNYYDRLLAERFPGAERFYAKRGYPIYPYEKSFVKKPDTATRYYLIITDPITHKRID